MTFVQAFYSFTIELTNTDTNLYAKWRIKTPRHPEEPLEYLYARTLALLHCYTDGVCFSHGLFEPDEPAIWKRSALGELELWADVGHVEKRKLSQLLKMSKAASLPPRQAIYFFECKQVGQMCHQLRGSKTNWVEDVEFYLIDPSAISQLVPLERSSAHWEVTIVDDLLYLVCDKTEVQAPIFRLNIWDEYQKSLRATADEKRIE